MANNDYEKLQQIQQDRFDELHSKELREITKNYTIDEQTDICKVVSSSIMIDELQRRENAIDDIFDNLMKTLRQAYDMKNVFPKNLSLTEKETLMSEVRKVVRV